MYALYILLALFVGLAFLRPRPSPHVLNIYFGVPGSGKTTFAAYLAKQSLKTSKLVTYAQKHDNRFCRWFLARGWGRRAVPVWSNVPITGTYVLDAKSDLGIHHIENGKLIIDEAGIEFNNRNYKAFPPEAIYFFKYHRHYKMSIDVFSQSHEDMDVTLRRLAQNCFIVKSSIIPFFVVRKRVRRKIGIDKEAHQILDQYDFGIPILDSKWIFCPPLWKLFNSYSRKELKQKEWVRW